MSGITKSWLEERLAEHKQLLKEISKDKGRKDRIDTEKIYIAQLENQIENFDKSKTSVRRKAK